MTTPRRRRSPSRMTTTRTTSKMTTTTKTSNLRPRNDQTGADLHSGSESLQPRGAATLVAAGVVVLRSRHSHPARTQETGLVAGAREEVQQRPDGRGDRGRPERYEHVRPVRPRAGDMDFQHRRME